MVTSRVTSGKAFGVGARRPLRRPVECWRAARGQEPRGDWRSRGNRRL